MERRIHGLDGLRALAFLAVLGYHYLPRLMPGGFLGVNIFFVLSGYLIAFTSLRDFDRDGFAVGSFYLRRLRRILPALIFTLGSWVCITRLLGPDMLGLKRGEAMSILLGYDNLYQLAGSSSYFENIGGPRPFTHAWSLAIEMQFYLVWPLFFLAFIRSWSRGGSGLFLPLLLSAVSLLMMLLGYEQGADPTPIYYGSHSRIWALLLGVSLAFYQYDHRPRRYYGGIVPGLLLVLGFLFLCLVAKGTEARSYYLYLPLSAVLALAMLCLLSHFPMLGKVLDFGPLSWIGQRSYELYLTHYPAYYLVSHLSTGRIGPLGLLIALGLSLLWADWLFRAGRALSDIERRTGHEKKNIPQERPAVPADRKHSGAGRRAVPAHLAGARPRSGGAFEAGAGGKHCRS